MSEEEAPNIRIVRDRLVYANSYGDLHDDDVEFLPGGIPGRYLRWRWRARYSVAVLALEDPGTALLVRNFRHSARRDVLEAVKGFGDDTRAPGDVARDELHQELGFHASSLTFLGISVADPGFAYHPMHCFLAAGGIDRQRRPEDSEAIGETVRFAVSRTPEALTSGEVLDAVTLLLLWQAREVARGGTGGGESPVPDAGRSD
jgi:8-oxo-dGTP pyrophosphatase MutT (NUDIX family)